MVVITASNEAPRATGKDGAVHCANCESETSGSYCAVCGALTSQHDGSRAQTHLLAGWWQRVGATLIDNVILFIPTELVIRLVGGALNFVLADLAALVVEGIYMYVLLSSPRAQTIGNRAMRTRVCDAKDAVPLRAQQVLKRYGFVAFYSFFVVFGGAAVTLVGLVAMGDALFPLVTPLKQTLHDRYAATIVVKL